MKKIIKFIIELFEMPIFMVWLLTKSFVAPMFWTMLILMILCFWIVLLKG